jgi:hypothetical protein
MTHAFGKFRSRQTDRQTESVRTEHTERNLEEEERQTRDRELDVTDISVRKEINQSS